MIRHRQHVAIVIATVATLALAGCGSAPTAAKLTMTPAAAQAALKVNKQHAAIAIQAPAASGAITMSFALRQPVTSPASGLASYALQATSADVAKLTVELKTRSFLLTRTVATAEVTRAQMVAGRAAVAFTGLAAGSYTLDIKATDNGGTQLGTTTASATVVDGQTTTVDARLQVSGGAAAGATGIGVNLEVIDG